MQFISLPLQRRLSFRKTIDFSNLFLYFHCSPKSLICIFSIYHSGCNGDQAIYQSDGNFVSFNDGGFFILTSNPHSQVLVVVLYVAALVVVLAVAFWSSDTTYPNSQSCK